MTVRGSCFCGSITYEIDGNLSSGRSCHCQNCRKAFSSQASAYALVESKEFSWITGEELLTSYESKKTGEGLVFCSNCGSTLCGTANGQVNGVTLGCVDGEPDVSIEMHIFVAEKANWEIIPESVLCYAKGPPQTT